MTAHGNFGLVILASGLSKRFGDQDKLLASFCDQPLAKQSAMLAAGLRLSPSICVLRPHCPELEKLFTAHKIDLVINDAPEAGQGHSLALGIKAIAERGCDYAYVVLADMPLVTAPHLELLRTQISDHEAAIAFDGRRRSPPALFRRSLFPKLINQSGDSGAKEILRTSNAVKNVSMPANILIDIDVPDDLKKAEAFAATTQ